MPAESPVGLSSVHARANIRETPHYSKPPDVSGKHGRMRTLADKKTEKPKAVKSGGKIKKTHMEQQKVDMFVGMNVENFNPQDLMAIKEKLEQMDDSKFFLVQGTEFQKPSTILLIAILLGWERFWLNDVGMGILKILTCYGCLIWWIVDIFSAKERAKKYNYKKFVQATMLS